LPFDESSFFFGKGFDSSGGVEVCEELFKFFTAKFLLKFFDGFTSYRQLIPKNAGTPFLDISHGSIFNSAKLPTHTESLLPFFVVFLLGGIFSSASIGRKDTVGSNTGGHGPLEVIVIINSLAEL